MRTDQAGVPSARLVDPHAPDPDEGTLGFERLVFFSDAVFAIVITLLVLPLTAEIDLPQDGKGLAAAVFHRWPTILTFVVSFLVIGQFWAAHHRTFGLIERQDQTLVWLNLGACSPSPFCRSRRPSWGRGTRPATPSRSPSSRPA